MTSREFCYWLQGFFEISGDSPPALSTDQIRMVKNHLAMVFKHEIDPSYPDGELLDKIHAGSVVGKKSDMGNIQIRC